MAAIDASRQTAGRPTLASVVNTVGANKHAHLPSHRSKSSSSSEGQDDSSTGSQSSENTQISSEDTTIDTAVTGPQIPFPAISSKQLARATPGKPNSPVKDSSSTRISSLANVRDCNHERRLMTPSSSSHANLAAGLLTPTLASALGISTNGRRNRPSQRRQNTSPATPTSSRYSQSSRSPSVPIERFNDHRLSYSSVTPFESLPEDSVASVQTSAPTELSASKIKRPGLSAAQSSCDVAGEASSMRFLQDTEARNPSGIEQSSADWSKRRLTATELVETERTFVATLNIINDHYYQPLLALSKGSSVANCKFLSTARPVLSRNSLGEIFSNFFDILRLNTELLARLEERLGTKAKAANIPGLQNDETSTAWDPRTDIVGDLLVTMAPFLKMYSFYVKNFSNALNRIEMERKSDSAFARFLKETDSSTWMTLKSASGLGLQAHLLCIVQRIPRYRLLVGVLLGCTPPYQRDYRDLTRAYHVIEQVATSINETVRQHELMLEMLGLQKQFTGLTFPLIVPGRSLLKRGTLLKGGRRDINPREFFLFTDCIIYAAPVLGAMADASAAAWSALGYNGASDSTESTLGSAIPRHGGLMGRQQKRPIDEPRRRTTSFPARTSMYRMSQSLDGLQLQYKDKLALQDCTVVAVDDAASIETGLRFCFEIHSPGRSFAVYAESQASKDDWIQAIRSAREEWQNNRRTLQAEEDSIRAKRDKRQSLLAMQSQITSAPLVQTGKSDKSAWTGFGRARRESMPSLNQNCDQSAPPRIEGTNLTKPGLRILEDYNAPVWVPDSLADKCACCNDSFGIWRRKHHCRLCGKVVCWACSSRNFLIASYEEGEQDRLARACDPCYDSVFAVRTASLVRPASYSPQNPCGSAKPDSEDGAEPSGPATPTSSGQQPCQSPASIDGTFPLRDSIHFSVSSPGTSQSALQLPDEHLRPPPTGYISPATRVAKAALDDAQLFNGLLNPRVHAATSGAGTFRLVTPRLTTPEHEYPHEERSSDRPPEVSNQSSDYFTGAKIGQTELSSRPTSFADNVVPRPVDPNRRKPLSAAARLSSVFGALRDDAMPTPKQI